MKLTDRVKSTVQKYRLLKKGDCVLVALSGGPDSVSLLYLLNSLKKDFCLKLICAHLNHMLRGRDSRQDLLFAQKLSEKFKIPFFYEEINVRKLKTNSSLEERARKIRQDFLFRVANEVGADKIASGHTKDDQSETVLMRLLRGAGLYGLSAILPRRKISKYIFIRPLIEVTKNEVLAYLSAKFIPYRVDKTNKQDIYFRNRIRNRLIPELKKYNKNIVDVLSHTAESASLDYEFIRKEAEGCFKKIKIPKNCKEIRIKIKDILKLHHALRRMILRLSIEKLKGNLRRIDYRHIEELEDLIDNRKFGSIVDLPQGISVLKGERLIKFIVR